MARKFALYLKDGHEVRNNIEEIREYFDYGKMVEHFHDGSLQQWLDDRHYEAESIALSVLEANAPDFQEKLCYIFRVDSASIEPNDIITDDEEIIKKKAVIRQYTTDDKVLNAIDSVATNQDELKKLLSNNPTQIYLCGSEFSITAKGESIKYIGVGNVTVKISHDDIADIEKKNITFENINIDVQESAKKSEQAMDTHAEEIVHRFMERNGIEKDIDTYNQENKDVDIALEILACLINGETERGEFIWKSRSRIKWNYGFRNLDLDLSMLERDIYCRIRGWIDKYNERIILIIEDEYKGLFMPEGRLNNELLVLTDEALYYYGEGKQYRCGYCDLMDVTVPLAGTVLIDLQNGKRLHINKRRTVSEVGDESLRLFLLIMAKRFGDCRYEFTSAEKSILEKIGLDNNGENRSSIYNFGTNKGCTECDDKKERENIWTKIAAELLGVIIHGELRNGQIIFAREGHKKETGKITYTALPVNEFAEVNIVPALKVHLSQYNNFVIGLVFEHGYRTFDQYLIFGDKAIYTQNSNLEWFSIRYEKINKVKVMNNSELVITMCDEKGWKFLPGSKLWKNKVGLNNFRLFLLIAARMLGDCKYEFTGEELKKLRKVKLDSLDGICILDCM